MPLSLPTPPTQADRKRISRPLGSGNGKEKHRMKRIPVALGAMIATLCMALLMSAPAQADRSNGADHPAASSQPTAPRSLAYGDQEGRSYVLIGGRYWTTPVCKSDSAGTGTLKICFRFETGARGEQTDGFYIESYTISAASGGLVYQGIGGHGGSMWSCPTCSPFWSINGDQSSLNPGQFKTWDLEIAKPDIERLAGGWHYEDIFVPGDNVNQCAKIVVYHNGNTDKGGC